MTNLKGISDSELLASIKRLAVEERRIGIEVLHHLREIDARKLFASLGFSSLFVYCTNELGYSEGGAYRRISAMRLLRDVPEYESKLQEGAVSVATLSQVQSFLVQEKRQLGKTYSQGEKLDLLSKIEGKSTQQTERVLAIISPQLSREEKARIINEEETEIRFTAGRELMRKIERLKNLLGHKPEAQSYAGLIDELTNIAIKKLDPLEKSNPKNASEIKSVKKAKVEVQIDQSLPPVEVVDGQLVSVEIGKDKKSTRYIPAGIEREVWKRDGGQCTYRNAETNGRCGSRHGLEMEHLRPFSQEGEATLENLTLLCPAHNQLAAIQAYGLPKMQRFWKI
jgi:5-methylcytosine-specific restriction endonuclease McrA